MFEINQIRWRALKVCCGLLTLDLSFVLSLCFFLFVRFRSWHLVLLGVGRISSKGGEASEIGCLVLFLMLLLVGFCLVIIILFIPFFKSFWGKHGEGLDVVNWRTMLKGKKK